MKLKLLEAQEVSRRRDDLRRRFCCAAGRGTRLIRVAHVKSNYGHVGGIESMLESLMPEFALQPGIEPLVIFLSSDPDPALEARLSAGGRVRLIRLPWPGLAASPKAALSAVKAVVRLSLIA